MLSLGRRILQRLEAGAMSSSRGGAQQQQSRGLAGHGSYAPPPKPDTSLDHVFGDSSYKVDFDFSPPAMMTTFGLTVATLAFFGFPAWMMVYEENKMANFKADLAAARLAKESAK